MFVSLFLVNQETRKEREGRNGRRKAKENEESKRMSVRERGGSLKGALKERRLEEGIYLNGNEGREGCGTF